MWRQTATESIDSAMARVAEDGATGTDAGAIVPIGRGMHDAGDGLILECIDDENRFAALRADWERLEGLDPACTPFNTWLWASLWWRHYKDHGDVARRLHLLVLRRAGTSTVVAIAPLQLCRERWRGLTAAEVLRFIGSGVDGVIDGVADGLNLVAEPAWREAAERRVVDHVLGARVWDCLELTDVSCASSLARTLDERLSRARGARLSGGRHVIRAAGLPPDWAFYRRVLGRRRRQSSAPLVDRADAAATNLVFAIARGDAERDAAREALAELRRARRHGRVGQDAGERDDGDAAVHAAFHRDVIEGFFARDALWLATLSLDGRVVGVLYLLRWRETLILVQGAHASTHADPGHAHVLLTYVIGEGIAHGLERIDVLADDTLDQIRGYRALDTRETRDFVLARPGRHAVLGRLCHWWQHDGAASNEAG